METEPINTQFKQDTHKSAVKLLLCCFFLDIPTVWHLKLSLSLIAE